MFGKYDDDEMDILDSGELEGVTDMLDNAGIDYDVDEDDGFIITLDNGVEFQFDESGALVSISPGRKS